MHDFSEIDESVRHFAMVGCFMSVFAEFEAEVLTCIGRALRLEPRAEQSLGPNIDYSRKIAIAKALWHIAFKNDEFLKGSAANAAGNTRNMIAHSRFALTPDGKGLKFFRVIAGEKYNDAPLVWDAEKFADEVATLRKLQSEVAAATPKLRNIDFNEKKFNEGFTRDWMFDNGGVDAALQATYRHRNQIAAHAAQTAGVSMPPVVFDGSEPK